MRAPGALLSNSKAMPVATALTMWWKASVATSSGARKMAGGEMAKGGHELVGGPQRFAPQKRHARARRLRSSLAFRGSGPGIKVRSGRIWDHWLLAGWKAVCTHSG